MSVKRVINTPRRGIGSTSIQKIEQLARDGVPLQLNAACLTKPLHRKRYLTWIEGGCVRYLGSDIHMLGSGYQDWEKCARLLEKRVP